MGMFIREDREYDESVRQKGFRRYQQLLSIWFGHWWKTNLLTLAGFLPLAAGLIYAIGSASVLVMLPCSILGGIIAGPFLAGLYDAILRGLRDDPQPWWDCYRRAFKQNWKDCMIPGALLGLFIGVYAFMGMLFWWAEVPPSMGTIVLYLVALLLTLVIHTLYWPQLVLFRQKAGIRLRNCLLFCVRYFWRVMGVGLLQLFYWALYLLFAPWTVLLLPFIGVWYIVFLSMLLIYDNMDESFHIEELYSKDAVEDCARGEKSED